MHKLRDKINQYSYIIIPADGAGSKGDEALISGCLSLLQGQKALLVTPNRNQWSNILFGRTHLFDECVVSRETLPKLIEKPLCLILLGADTVDGTWGEEEACCRLEAVKAALSCGGKAVIFCSIRPNMSERVIQSWKNLPEDVMIFLRDSVSMENFRRQVERPAQYFPDLSFFLSQLRRSVQSCFRVKFIKFESIRGLLVCRLVKQCSEAFALK